VKLPKTEGQRKIFNDKLKARAAQRQEQQDKEREIQKKANKTDHIKKIFSAFNFKTKSSTHDANFDFDGQKKRKTLDCDFTNHYKKSFMKTCEESFLRHKIIIRK
jgi:hypothetical protein